MWQFLISNVPESLNILRTVSDVAAGQRNLFWPPVLPRVHSQWPHFSSKFFDGVSAFLFKKFFTVNKVCC